MVTIDALLFLFHTCRSEMLLYPLVIADINNNVTLLFTGQTVTKFSDTRDTASYVFDLSINSEDQLIIPRRDERKVYFYQLYRQ